MSAVGFFLAAAYIQSSVEEEEAVSPLTQVGNDSVFASTGLTGHNNTLYGSSRYLGTINKETGVGTLLTNARCQGLTSHNNTLYGVSVEYIGPGIGLVLRVEAVREGSLDVVRVSIVNPGHGYSSSTRVNFRGNSNSYITIDSVNSNGGVTGVSNPCLLYTSPSPRDS